MKEEKRSDIEANLVRIKVKVTKRKNIKVNLRIEGHQMIDITLVMKNHQKDVNQSLLQKNHQKEENQSLLQKRGKGLIHLVIEERNLLIQEIMPNIWQKDMLY